jgi:hypothetical protein
VTVSATEVKAQRAVDPTAMQSGKKIASRGSSSFASMQTPTSTDNVSCEAGQPVRTELSAS